jgi:hypothetical protein
MVDDAALLADEVLPEEAYFFSMRPIFMLIFQRCHLPFSEGLLGVALSG